jgi:hypothetical protein
MRHNVSKRWKLHSALVGNMKGRDSLEYTDIDARILRKILTL